MAGCPVLMSDPDHPLRDAGPCRRAVHLGDGEGRCFFHTKMEKEPARFMQKFVRLAGAAVQQGQPLDCTRFIFPDFELKFRFQFRAAANFRKAAFLQGAGFSGATFSQYACFDSSTFNQTAAFYDAIFMQDAAFGNAIFMQDAVFDRTIFMQHTLFAGANFAQDARFVGATFTTDTWFTHAIFAGGGVFPLVKAKNHLSFRKCVVKGAWDWEDTTIYPMATLSFNQAEVEGDLILKDLRFPSPEAAIGLDKENRKEWETLEKMMGGLRACPFQETLTVYTARDPDVRIDFRNVQQRSTSSIVMQGVDAPGDPDTGRGRLDLSKVRFAHTDTSRIKLQNVRWNGPRAWGTGKIPRVADEHFIRSLPGRAPSSNVQDGKDDGEVDPREEGVGPIIVVDPYTGLRGSSEAWALAEEALDPIIVADVYKGLRISYESSLHYSEAGAFHAREMEMRRLGT